MRFTLVGALLSLAACSADPSPAPDPYTNLIWAAIADYGVDDNDELAVSRVVKGWAPSFVITLGDNNYEDGLSSTIDPNIGKYYGEYIGDYQGVFGKGSASNRFWPALGNHDWDAAMPGSCQPYLDYFQALPGNRRYYDVEIGPIHFFVVDSDPREPDGITANSAQAQWLEPQLKASTSCFNIVYFHHPPYSSGDPIFTEPELRWPYKQWGADLVLTGHQHQYERLIIDGFTYVVAGLGGALNRFDFATTQPGSVVRYNADFGALRARVTHQEIDFEFHNTSGDLIDSFSIPAHCL
jgi:hypothetical protein